MESAMRRNQLTLSASEVQRHFHAMLAPVLGPWPMVRTCTVEAVLTVLAYAAARITSLTDACRRLANAPDSDTVLGHLARQLPMLKQKSTRLNSSHLVISYA